MKRKLTFALIMFMTCFLFGKNMIHFRGGTGFFEATHDFYAYNSLDGYRFYPGFYAFAPTYAHEGFEYLYEFESPERNFSPVVGGGLGVSAVGITGYGITGISINVASLEKLLVQLFITGELGGGGVPIIGYGFFMEENADVIISRKNKGLYLGTGVAMDQVIYPSQVYVLPLHFFSEVHVYIGVRF